MLRSEVKLTTLHSVILTSTQLSHLKTYLHYSKMMVCSTTLIFWVTRNYLTKQVKDEGRHHLLEPLLEGKEHCPSPHREYSRPSLVTLYNSSLPLITSSPPQFPILLTCFTFQQSTVLNLTLFLVCLSILEWKLRREEGLITAVFLHVEQCLVPNKSTTNRC